MGMIRIEFRGSFHDVDAITDPIEFSAEEGGHADAIARALEFLAGTIQGPAIALDHKLAKEGHEPRKPFGHGKK